MENYLPRIPRIRGNDSSVVTRRQEIGMRVGVEVNL